MAVKGDKKTIEIKDKSVIYGTPKYGFELLPIVNPDAKTCIKHGIYVKRDEDGTPVEPSYLITKDKSGNALDHTMLRLAFYAKLRNPEGENVLDESGKLINLNDFVIDITHFMRDIPRPESKKKNTVQYINSIGQTQWANPEIGVVPSDYFDVSAEPIRVALDGESNVLEFLHKAAGIKQGEYSISDWDAIFNGDYSEIIEIIEDINSIKDYKGFKMLLAVGLSSNNRAYQTAYTKAFDLGNSKRLYNIPKQLKQDESTGFVFKGWFDNSTVIGLHEYRGQKIDVNSTSEESNSDSNVPWED